MTRFGIGFRSSAAARLARVVTLGALVLLGATGAAHAGSWALVNPDGTLTKYKGVLANFKEGAGHYRIVFRRSIERCVPVATSNDGALIIVHETGNRGEVEIFAYSTLSNTYQDRSFYIALVC